MQDADLLKRYRDDQDTEAFAEVVGRHAGIVYGTALRITGNAHGAEDVIQECFIALAKERGPFPRCLAAWLHRTAVNRSLNLVRGIKRRSDHEQSAARTLSESRNESATWEDLAPHVDKAIEQLPDELREPLVLYYLREMIQEDIAKELGISCATVSRRIDNATEELRRTLRKSGVIVSVVLLGALLRANVAQAATTTLKTSVLQLATQGIEKGFIMGIKVKSVGVVTATVMGILAVVLVGALVISQGRNGDPKTKKAINRHTQHNAGPDTDDKPASKDNTSKPSKPEGGPQETARAFVDAMAKGDIDAALGFYLTREECLNIFGEENGDIVHNMIAGRVTRESLQSLAEKMAGAEYVEWDPSYSGGEPTLVTPQTEPRLEPGAYAGPKVHVPIELLDNTHVIIRIGDKEYDLKLDAMIRIAEDGKDWRLGQLPRLSDQVHRRLPRD